METLPTPLVYGGGFLNKTLVFETLVRRDRDGSWSVSPDGREWVFDLRPGARFHSGAPCDAEAVRRHMVRWLGDAEDAFIPAATRIESVAVRGPLTVVFRCRERLDLPPDLAIINPMAIVGPGAERGQTVPVLDGTGPFRVAEYEPMRRFLLERNEAYDGARPASPAVELCLFPAASSRDAIGLWALRRGHIDALIEDWTPKIPRAAAVALAEKDERFVLERAPGSATLLLIFNSDRAPFSDVAWRRRVAAAVDRQALIRDIEAGLASPAYSLFAPGIVLWPDGVAPTVPSAEPVTESVRAELLVSESNPEQILAHRPVRPRRRHLRAHRGPEARRRAAGRMGADDRGQRPRHRRGAGRRVLRPAARCQRVLPARRSRGALRQLPAELPRAAGLRPGHDPGRSSADARLRAGSILGRGPARRHRVRAERFGGRLAHGLRRRALFNAAGLYENVGNIVSDGIDLVLAYDFAALAGALRGFTVQSSVTWQDAEIEDAVDPANEGNEVPYAWEEKAAWSLQYETEELWRIALGGVYVGDSFSDEANTAVENANGNLGINSSRTIWDAQLSHDTDWGQKARVRFSVGVTNLFDDEWSVHSRGGFFGGGKVAGPPQQLYVGLQVNL